MKMYCLTCSNLRDRNNAVQLQFDEHDLSVTMFDGVHGATVGVAPTLSHFDSPGHFITSGKLSITISKMLLWTKLCEEDDDIFLVFENDVVLCDNFRIELEKSVEALPADWDVVHVGHCCTEDKPVETVNDRVAKVKYPMCCHAILWRKRAIRFALARFREISWGSPSDVMLAECVYPHLSHYVFTPGLATQGIAVSEAGSGGRWDTIQGWFDYSRIYDEAIDRVVGPAKFVEVGAWLGRSTAYMAEEIKRRYKPVEFFAVDTWRGSANEPDMKPTLDSFGGDIYSQFMSNMLRAGVSQYVVPMRMQSADAAKFFPDECLDFVFIDGDHSFGGVTSDIEAWRGKVKLGGVIAGHDFDRSDVAKAVRRQFGDRFRVWERCWIVDGNNG